ncbi:hypothetical protein [Saccharopolyspora oryzae]|uniref:Uncharacterized protein n=1 Tax=Saccharopolyspora oryzae TaxID=2997343 RepID=A0ABT4UZU0_9PSEU|nr:hypothetical protein [Saccharopolyspora oryzae]MDA3627233.1 hypothetical protein [Saccharopolyspora oryzae]
MSAKAKEVEDKVHAATEVQRAKLEEDAAQARTAAQERSQEIRERIEKTKSDAAARWRDLQESWDRHVQQIQASVEKKRHELDVKQASKHAEVAEADAEFAVAHAMAAIEEAEYAALEALLARNAANELRTSR